MNAIEFQQFISAHENDPNFRNLLNDAPQEVLPGDWVSPLTKDEYSRYLVLLKKYRFGGPWTDQDSYVFKKLHKKKYLNEFRHPKLAAYLYRFNNELPEKAGQPGFTIKGSAFMNLYFRLLLAGITLVLIILSITWLLGMLSVK